MLAAWHEHSESSIPGPSITSLHEATSAGTSFALTPVAASSSSSSAKRHGASIGSSQHGCSCRTFNLVVETRERHTLSEGLQWLNGTYAAMVQRQVRARRPLLSGAFQEFLIEKDAYPREAVRYVVLNPVRAKMAECA
jgi:hypothetical protein